VEPGYPLRGVLHLNQGPGQPDLEVRAIPESGHAWVDAPLLEALG
jgi:putative ABC transport system permease protein